jgi:enamine deaminase RidA (YjgF/YER057c/UK114 family)
MRTRHHRDGGGWEAAAGYARAVRRGRRIEVSGTTVPGRGPEAEEETHRQTVEAIDRALAAVAALGGSIDDVVRTRLFLAPGADWRQAAAAHADRLGSVAPANTTLFVAGLIGDALVEVEVEAETADEAGVEVEGDLPTPGTAPAPAPPGGAAS